MERKSLDERLHDRNAKPYNRPLPKEKASHPWAHAHSLAGFGTVEDYSGSSFSPPKKIPAMPPLESANPGSVLNKDIRECKEDGTVARLLQDQIKALHRENTLMREHVTSREAYDDDMDKHHVKELSAAANHLKRRVDNNERRLNAGYVELWGPDLAEWTPGENPAGVFAMEVRRKFGVDVEKYDLVECSRSPKGIKAKFTTMLRGTPYDQLAKLRGKQDGVDKQLRIKASVLKSPEEAAMDSAMANLRFLDGGKRFSRVITCHPRDGGIRYRDGDPSVKQDPNNPKTWDWKFVFTWGEIRSLYTPEEWMAYGDRRDTWNGMTQEQKNGETRKRMEKEKKGIPTIVVTNSPPVAAVTAPEGNSVTQKRDLSSPEELAAKRGRGEEGAQGEGRNLNEEIDDLLSTNGAEEMEEDK